MTPFVIAGGIVAAIVLRETKTGADANGIDPSLIGTSGTITGGVTDAGGESVGTDPDCPNDANGHPQWWCKTFSAGDLTVADAARQAAAKLAHAAESLIGALIPDWVWAALVVGGAVYLVHSGVL